LTLSSFRRETILSHQVSIAQRAFATLPHHPEKFRKLSTHQQHSFTIEYSKVMNCLEDVLDWNKAKCRRLRAKDNSISRISALFKVPKITYQNVLPSFGG
jgi:hypothetical protein